MALATQASVNQVDAMQTSAERMRALRNNARDLGGLVWQAVVMRRWAQAWLTRLHARFGLTDENREVLEWLARERTPVSASLLGWRMNVSRQQVFQALQRLPDPGWIRRVRQPSYRCQMGIALTARGRRFVQRVRLAEEETLRNVVLLCTPLDFARCWRSVAAANEALIWATRSLPALPKKRAAAHGVPTEKARTRRAFPERMT